MCVCFASLSQEHAFQQKKLTELLTESKTAFYYPRYLLQVPDRAQLHTRPPPLRHRVSGHFTLPPHPRPPPQPHTISAPLSRKYVPGILPPRTRPPGGAHQPSPRGWPQVPNRAQLLNLLDFAVYVRNVLGCEHTRGGLVF